MELNAAEAIAAFCGWLTTRKQIITFSSHHDCVPVCDAMKAFSESQNLPEVRDDFSDRILKYPE